MLLKWLTYCELEGVFVCPPFSRTSSPPGAELLLRSFVTGADPGRADEFAVSFSSFFPSREVVSCRVSTQSVIIRHVSS